MCSHKKKLQKKAIWDCKIGESWLKINNKQAYFSIKWVKQRWLTPAPGPATALPSHQECLRWTRWRIFTLSFGEISVWGIILTSLTLDSRFGLCWKHWVHWTLVMSLILPTGLQLASVWWRLTLQLSTLMTLRSSLLNLRCCQKTSKG